MSNLRHFSASEVYISRHEAWSILRFFWPNNTLAEQDLTDQDINFAQALLLEAIDASYAMGYVHIVFDTFYGKVPGSFVDVQKMVKEFSKKAAKHWFKHLGSKSLANAEIYAAVRNQIAGNFGVVLRLRQDTGELDY